jgi:hypothetical protein
MLSSKIPAPACAVQSGVCPETLFIFSFFFNLFYICRKKGLQPNTNYNAPVLFVDVLRKNKEWQLIKNAKNSAE